MKDIYILAIESSCDETSISIVKNGHDVVALTILTQMDTHAKFGGVVPEIASRMHAENITMVLEDTLNKANMTVADVDAIAVAYKPGLMGSLLVGVEFAKTLSYVYDKPLIGVNHLIGHIYANNLEDNLEYPLLALVISGGHTELAIMKNDYEFDLLGSTLDDAIGEAFDKVARVIGYPYPGGPNIEKAAANGSQTSPGLKLHQLPQLPPLPPLPPGLPQFPPLLPFHLNGGLIDKSKSNIINLHLPSPYLFPSILSPKFLHTPSLFPGQSVSSIYNPVAKNSIIESISI